MATTISFLLSRAQDQAPFNFKDMNKRLPVIHPPGDLGEDIMRHVTNESSLLANLEVKQQIRKVQPIFESRKQRNLGNRLGIRACVRWTHEDDLHS
jgi:hypothetical protein